MLKTALITMSISVLLIGLMSIIHPVEAATLVDCYSDGFNIYHTKTNGDVDYIYYVNKDLDPVPVPTLLSVVEDNGDEVYVDGECIITYEKEKGHAAKKGKK